MGCDRFLSVWRVRSLIGGVGVRSLLGCWECDRFWGVGGAIAILGMFGVGERSLLGCWECDRFLRGVGMRSLFGMWRMCDRLLGMLGERSLFEDVGMRSLFEDVGVRSLFGGLEDVRRFWDVGMR